MKLLTQLKLVFMLYGIAYIALFGVVGGEESPSSPRDFRLDSFPMQAKEDNSEQYSNYVRYLENRGYPVIVTQPVKGSWS